VSISFYQPPSPSSDEDARVRSIDALGVLNLRSDPVLDRVVHDLRRRMSARLSLLSVLREDLQHVLVADGLPLGVYDRRRSFCGHAVTADAALFWVADLSADPRFAGNPWVSGEAERLRFYAGALIPDPEGLAIGVVCVADIRPRYELGSTERTLLLDAARAASDRFRTSATGSVTADVPVRPATPSAAAADPPRSPLPRP